MKTTVKDLQLIQTWQGASVVIPLSSSEAEEVAELKKKADDGKPLQFELKIIRNNVALMQMRHYGFCYRKWRLNYGQIKMRYILKCWVDMEYLRI